MAKQAPAIGGSALWHLCTTDVHLMTCSRSWLAHARTMHRL